MFVFFQDDSRIGIKNEDILGLFELEKYVFCDQGAVNITKDTLSWQREK